MAPARFKDSVVTKTLERVHQMKKATTLPYDLSALQWDPSHRENSAHTYCYCGTYGTWFKSMVQCAKCEQWFHERCLSPRPKSMPIVDGDPFYLFLCSVCNQGRECLKRIDFDLPDLMHLVLFNLTLSTLRKAHRYDEHILPYIESQWAMFQPPDSLSNLTTWQREDRILDVLLKHKDRFGMLRQKRLESSVWWLSVVAPPPGPRFRVTSEKILTEKTILNEVYVGRNKVDPSKVECCLPNYLLDTTIPKQAAEVERHLADDAKKSGETTTAPCSSLAGSDTETHTASTDLRPAGRQTRSLTTSANLTLNGETKLAPEEKPIKFKFPKVAMKFCANQRIKMDRKGNEVICAEPMPEEKDLGSAKMEPPVLNLLSDVLTYSPGENVLDRFIPVPDSFVGPNNPFRLRDDKIREARKMLCTRRLELEDITKSKKLKRRRRPLPLQESRLLWRQQPTQFNQSHGFEYVQSQPSTSTSSASSECSSYDVVQYCSRRKRKLLHLPLDNNNIIRHHNNNNNFLKTRKKAEEKVANDSGDDCERLIMTRNRTRELSASMRKRQVVGRRLVAPGVYQLLVQFG